VKRFISRLPESGRSTAHSSALNADRPVSGAPAWLPTGAGISLLRNVVYFDGAAIAGPLMVLAGWGAFGLTLELAAQARTRLTFVRRGAREPLPA
jgi:hypothetical protein